MSANKENNAGDLDGVMDLYAEDAVQNDDGKLTVDTLYYDNLAVLVQLGLLPEAVPA